MKDQKASARYRSHRLWRVLGLAFDPRAGQRRSRIASLVAVIVVVAMMPAVSRPAANAATPPRGPAPHQDDEVGKTGFEVVPVTSVPAPAEGNAGSIRTYPLDPDPNAYSTSGPTVSGIRFVTFVRPGEDANGLSFDVYLHGAPDDWETPAFRIPGLDLRRFLQPSLAGVQGAEGVARLQAYFAEFARKAKILYPLPGSEAGRAGQSPYQETVVPVLRSRLQALLAADDPDAGDRESLERALARLDEPTAANLRAVDQNLRSMTRGGHEEREDAADRRTELAALDSAVLALSTARKVSDVVVTNNCREPGNYEIALRDASGRKLLHGAFAFPADTYDELLRAYHGIGIAEQATGVRYSSTLQALDPTYADAGSTREARAFPRVKVKELEGTLTPQKPGRGRVLKGSLAVVGGFIPYEDYETEVQVKSGYHGNDDPLSFVVVDPAKPPPLGFEPPTGISSADYWTSPRNAGKAVPHTFLRFEDLLDYDVRLSGFEVNGVYVGKTDLKLYDPERQEGRWPFRYAYLPNLARYELALSEDGLTLIRLLPVRGDGPRVGFSFGNLPLAVGESMELLFGIGSQPLIAPYNQETDRFPLSWAVAFDAHGWVADHHGPEIGVEQAYIERLGARRYRIRLVSHERIVPVWEAIVDAGS